VKDCDSLLFFVDNTSSISLSLMDSATTASTPFNDMLDSSLKEIERASDKETLLFEYAFGRKLISHSLTPEF
jgi:hypothetical protein